MGRRGWSLTIIGVLFVLAIGVMIAKGDQLAMEDGSRIWGEQVVNGKGTEKIVQLYVDGIIAEKASFNSSFNSPDFISQLDQAMKDQTVKGIVIRVNSPGGEVTASDEIHNKILEIKKYGKPVIISMGGTAASGGYYISAGADRIFANPTTLTGSLGVIFSIPNYQKAADWIGYKEYVIKSGTYKDIGSPTREMTDAEKEIFQKLVDENYQRFVSVIVEGRKLSRDQVLKMADGRVYSGSQAKQLGLIDEFGSLEDATKYAMQKSGLQNAKIVRYTPKFSFSNFLTGSVKQELSPAQMIQQLLPESSKVSGMLYLYQP